MAVALLGSGAGALWRPRRAHAAGITLDPTVDPLLQGYETDSTGDYAPGTRLAINDSSTGNHRTFFVPAPEIATSSVAVDVTVSIATSGVTLAGVDTGVRAILSEGAGGVELAAALIERAGGDRRVAFALAANSFSQGLAFDWTVEQTFRIERNPDSATRAVLTVSGQPPEVLEGGDLPPSLRANPNFEFGCSLDPATAVALFGPIGLTGVFPLTITPAHAVLIPNRIQGVALDGAFLLDAASDGIDPVTDGVALELSTPGGLFYPVGPDAMPVGMRTVPGGWSITDAERARTGIEFFLIRRTADPMRFRYVLLDGRSRLPAADYSQVRLDLAIGDDEGAADMTLVAGRRGIWFLR